MAFISKQEVQDKQAKLKVLNKQYGVKASFSGSNGSTLKLYIQSGSIDFISNYLDCSKQQGYFGTIAADVAISKKHIQVNHYYLEHSFDGVALEYLQKALEIMHEDHWDDSDLQMDYFNCSWYLAITIGRWDKPYVTV